jgi:hypothetical protein
MNKVFTPTDNIPSSIKLFFLFVIVLLSRLPFLFNGFGIEEDSWGLVLNSYEILEKGHYVYSRLPGHPVQELILAYLPLITPFAYNGLSAIFSAIACLFFALVMKNLSFRYYISAGLVLAFIPVFYINSVCTIDYCWAAAFIMISMYFLTKEKLIAAGIFLGIATGCRITSALMLIPFLFLLKSDDGIAFIKKSAILGITTFIVFVLVFLPAFIEYGISVISTYKQPYPPIPKVIFKGTIGVFGITGLIAISISMIIMFVNRRKRQLNFINTPHRRILFCSITAIIIYSIAYLRLPEKSAFLIPILPFLIILIAYYLKTPKAYAFFTIFMIASSFLFSINLTDKNRGSEYSKYSITRTISGQEIFFDPLNGPVYSDYTKRINKSLYISKVAGNISLLKGKNLIIAGWWYNQLTYELRNKAYCSNLSVVHNIDEKSIKFFKENGANIYYLSEQNILNNNRFESNFTEKYAIELPTERQK